MNTKEREEKWQRRWSDEKLFEVNPDSAEKKFFVNFPYPYMNGYLHLGHGFTLMRAEMAARYRRMRGDNVLFPFAFHCTGTPIVAAAERVKLREESQMRALEQMGISGKLAESLENPKTWTEHFPEHAKNDLETLGVAVDWRRSFITTELNPAYDGFIRWQFNKLKSREFLRKGKFPVVWCSEKNTVVGDHDRVEGEGETPQEFTLLKFRGESGTLVAATLRPETVFGQTNIWVDGTGEYTKAIVDGDELIFSSEMLPKLELQGHSVEKTGTVTGKELVGQKFQAPGVDREIMVLPSTFCDASIGSGIVTSVPSDAPDDYQGLVDLQNNKEECAAWGLDDKYIKEIKPIPIIDSGELGNLPAPKVCQEMNIQNQTERKALEQAKQQVYLHGFVKGTMLDNCGDCAGLSVELARNNVRDNLISTGDAFLFYELSGSVKSRWMTYCTVKIVENQWFLAYGDEQWTENTHNALKKMDIYPEKARLNFEKVLDWLRDWACAREQGLGTKLPWNDQWIIESLSDSTVYMAFYTVAHHFETLDKEAFVESLYDAIFDDGSISLASEKSGVSVEKIEAWKAEFNYWYPFDIRISGKDLIQNHLSFSLYNHVAVFEEKHHPKAFAVNGWLLVDGDKMSKSKGNFFTLRELVDNYGADVVRLTLCNSGEGLDDPNWEGAFVETVGKKLENWVNFSRENIGKGRADSHNADAWFDEILESTALAAREACDKLLFRTALRHLFFELPQYYRWYVQRAGEPNKTLLKKYISIVTRGIAPIAPHAAEEIWESLGGEGLISNAPYPEGREADSNILLSEDLLRETSDDIRKILSVAKIEKPEKITLITAPSWKWTAVSIAASITDERGQVSVKDLMSKAMAELPNEAKKEASNFLKNWALREIPSLGPDWAPKYQKAIDEQVMLTERKEFLEELYGCDIEVLYASDAPEAAKTKAKQALPLKPAIFIE